MLAKYELERRLQHWAAWIISINMNESGWPSESVISRIMQQGCFTIDHNKARTSSIPIYNTRAEETNTHINQMKLEFPKYADAIYHYYISIKKTKELAEERNISARTFRQRVHDAKIWLLARMPIEK